MQIRSSIVALSALLAMTGSAFAQDNPSPAGKCFYVNQFESWKAPDPQTIFIRANFHHYYRLDLSGPCPTLLSPDTHLILNVRGPDTICSALDWDLKVSQGSNGIPSACIVKKMTPLTAEEVSQIPPHFRP